MKERSNAGIELLRVVAMLMIVGLHYLGFGGVIHDQEAVNYKLGWFLEAFNFVAVDCYVLISGYLLVNSKGVKAKKAASLWLQVLFYTVGITMLFYHRAGVAEFTPILSKVYWFATVYFGLYLLHPLLNKVLRLDRSVVKWLLVSMVSVLVTLPFVWVESGYSLTWFVVLYMIGGYIKISDIRINKCLTASTYVILSIFTYCTKFGSYPDLFFSYNSISVLGAAVALFMCFKDMRITVPMIRKFCTYFGPLTFGVYLIHEHPLVRDMLWKSIKTEEYYSSPRFMCHYIVSILLIFFICAFVEKLRQVLSGVIGRMYMKGVEDRERVEDVEVV